MWIKRNIRHQENERLMMLLTECKEKLEQQKAIIAKSVEPPQEVINDMKLAEATYLFLLVEARHRRIDRRS